MGSPLFEPFGWTKALSFFFPDLKLYREVERKVSERLNDCRGVYPPVRCVMAVAYEHKRGWEGLNGNMSNLFVRGQGGGERWNGLSRMLSLLLQNIRQTNIFPPVSGLSGPWPVRLGRVAPFSNRKCLGPSMPTVKIQIELLSRLKTFKAFLLYVLKLNASTNIMVAYQSRSDQP